MSPTECSKTYTSVSVEVEDGLELAFGLTQGPQRLQVMHARVRMVCSMLLAELMRRRWVGRGSRQRRTV